MTKNRYSREFESQALVKVRERADKSVGTIAQELGMSEGTLRKWVTNANRKERAATPEAALPIDMAASAWSAASTSACAARRWKAPPRPACSAGGAPMPWA